MRSLRHSMLQNSIKIDRNLAIFELRNSRIKNIENKYKAIELLIAQTKIE